MLLIPVYHIIGLFINCAARVVLIDFAVKPGPTAMVYKSRYMVATVRVRQIKLSLLDH